MALEHQSTLSQFARDEYTSDREYYKTYLYLTEVPTDIPADALEVHLDRNEINKINANAFWHLSQCRELELSSNVISNVEPGAFNGLTGLTVLQMGLNRIRRLYVNMFADIPNCKVLDVSRNLISQIEHGSFCGLSNLVRLSLDSNYLTTLRADMFQGLVVLQVLLLSTNNIKSVEDYTFSELTSLGTIDLERNHLEHLPADVFKPLPRSFALGLGNNPFKCDSDLCWLKKEKLQGTIWWYLRARYHRNEPECDGGKKWRYWNCDDTGDTSFII